jgi:cyclase
MNCHSSDCLWRGGKMEHFADVFLDAHADAALAASIFHFKEIEIRDLKRYLHQKNIAIRL